MKILELILENFDGIYATMHVKKVRLDLQSTKNRICLITGPNGHGKTLLLSQLNPFATLGTLDERDSLPLIRSGENGYKMIIIQNGENEYKIEHFYTPSKTSHTIKSYIKKNGEELNPNGNVTSFKEVVSKELDMEQEYMKLVRLGNNVVNMIDLKSAERKTFMSKILEDANIYLKYYKKINGEVNTIKTLMSHVTNRLNKLNIKEGSTVEDLKDILSDSEKCLEDIEKKISSTMKHIGAIQYLLSSIPNDVEEQMKSSYSKLNKLNKKISGDFSIEKIQKDVMDLKIRIASEKEKRDQTSFSLDKVMDSLDTYRSTLDIILVNISRLEGDLDESELENIVEDLSNKVKEEEKIFEPYSEIPYTKKDLEDVLVFLKEKQKELNTTYEFGHIVVKKVAELMRKQKSVSDYIEEHSKTAKEDGTLKNAQIVIRNILRKYPDIKPGISEDSKINSLLEDLYEIYNLEFDVEKRDVEFYHYMHLAYNNIKNILTSFIDQKDIFKNLPTYLKDEFIVETLLKKIGECSAIYDQKTFFEELSFITEYENFLSHKEELENAKMELDKLRNDPTLPGLKLEADTLKYNIEKSKNSISEYKDTIDILKKDIYENELRLSELEDLEEIAIHKHELETIYETSKQALEKRKTLMEEKEEEHRQLTILEYEKSRLSKQIIELKNSIQQLKSANKELKVYKKYFDDWTMIKESLSSNTGIPLVFIDLYLNNALSVMNGLLSEIYDGDIYVDKFEITENKFEIPFIKHGKSIPDIRYASQGEKSFFSITMSFAISFQSMSKYNIMLLDELDSVLDESNRSHFIAILEKLIDMISAEQIFVISHNNMFSMYPVDVISVINEKPEDHKLSNYIPLEFH